MEAYHLPLDIKNNSDFPRETFAYNPYVFQPVCSYGVSIVAGLGPPFSCIPSTPSFPPNLARNIFNTHLRLYYASYTVSRARLQSSETEFPTWYAIRRLANGLYL